MATIILVTAAVIYGLGLRADRLHAQRTGQGSFGAELRRGEVQTVQPPSRDGASRSDGRGAGQVQSEPVAAILAPLHAQRTVKEPGVSSVTGPLKGSSSRTIRGSGTPRGTEAVPPGSSTAHGLYMRHSAGYWHWRYRIASSQVRATRAKLRQQWHPTVDYALRLASAVTGVSYWQMRSVSWCESRHDPFAQNGPYKGIFQMHWAPFGMSPFDPVASALSAAMTVKHDGGWRQWECKP